MALESDINPQWIDDLRYALKNLYDPVRLQKSPLLQILELSSPVDLQKSLTRAIQQMKPPSEQSVESSAWRIYNLLEYRFIEQISQKEVASLLTVSIRHLRRMEFSAIQQLAQSIYRQKNPAELPSKSGKSEEDTTPTSTQELEWLRQTTSPELVDVKDLIVSSCQFLSHFSFENNVKVETDLPDEMIYISGQLTTLREAMLILLTHAIQTAKRGMVSIQAISDGNKVTISIISHRVIAEDNDISFSTNDYNLAKQLLFLSGGIINPLTTSDNRKTQSIVFTLPVVNPVKVLIVDDNVDVLQLLERYLTNSRYTFFGSHQPEQVIEIALEKKPHVIVLDVMLPNIDGWDLLGRLREHPQTQDIPVIICTILPHESLAKTLGAAGFIRKPVSRQVFLSTLDQVVCGTVKEY